MAVVTISLGFAPARMVERSLNAYARTRHPDVPYAHYILDQHYPIEKQDNSRRLSEICEARGIALADAGRNLGLHDGFNWMLRMLDPILKPDDIVIAYDLDSTPLGFGWDLALVRAIEGSGGEVVWSSLMNPRSKADLEARGYDVRTVDGYLELWMTRESVTNSICAWRYGWLKGVNGLHEERPWYGHLESSMFSRLAGKRWAFLPGWTESDELRDLHDRAYVEYKWCHAHLKTWDGDFESWLAAGGPNPERAAPLKLP